jgi:hypothetical protein
VTSSVRMCSAIGLSGSRTRPYCLTSGFKLPPRTR